jgi:hypothetical protein
MELIFIFINPKKAFQEIKNKNIIYKEILIYIILFLALSFILFKNLQSNAFYGGLVQLSFNFVFLIFISLFIKVFIKIFGIDRKFIFVLSDTLLLYLPSFLLFFILIISNLNLVTQFSYGLIYLFTYKDSDILKKALFFFYYAPRILLYIYTTLGLRYIYDLNFKRSILITILIYFIIFIVYLF